MATQNAAALANLFFGKMERSDAGARSEGASSRRVSQDSALSDWPSGIAARNCRAVARLGHLWQRPRMGEVKVTVKLNNAMDLAMLRRGLIQPAEVRSVTVDAVVDTGAIRSCIPVDVMQQLGLRTVRRINAQMANGKVESVEMTEGVDMEILGRLVTEAFLVLGGEVLIGQTALEATDLHVDCSRQRVIPNPDHPNSAIIRIR